MKGISCCVHCKHCIPCKELRRGQWVLYFICDLFAHENEFPIGDADICECYTKK